jgi:hypothetical protein
MTIDIINKIKSIDNYDTIIIFMACNINYNFTAIEKLLGFKFPSASRIKNEFKGTKGEKFNFYKNEANKGKTISRNMIICVLYNLAHIY